LFSKVTLGGVSWVQWENYSWPNGRERFDQPPVRYYRKKKMKVALLFVGGMFDKFYFSIIPSL
jgi:hypothetical protein